MAGHLAPIVALSASAALALLGLIWRALRGRATKVQRADHALRAVLIGGLAGLALVAVTSNARASGTFTVGASSGFNLDGATYANAESTLSGASTLSLPLSIPDLQAITVNNVDFEHDDTHHSLTVQGDVTINNKGASLQLSAVWPDGTSTSPKLALAVKPTDSSLQALNAIWASAPVNPSLQHVMLIASPSSGYTFDTSKLPTAAQAFYPPGQSVTVGQGLTLLADVDASTDPNLSSALAFLDEGSTIHIQGTLSGSVAPLFGGATSAQEAGLDLTISVSGGSTLPSWISARTSSLHFTLSGSTPSVTISDDVTTNLNGKVNEFAGSLAYDPNKLGGATVDFKYALVGGTLQIPFGLDGLTLSNTALDLSYDTGAKTFGGTLDTDAAVGATTLHVHVGITKGSGNTVTGTFGITGPITLQDAGNLANSLLGLSVDASSLGTSVSLDSITFTFSNSAGTQEFSLDAQATVKSLAADVLVSIRHSTGSSPTVIVGLHLSDAGSQCNCITLSKLLPGTLSDLAQGLQLPAVNVYTSFGFGNGSSSVSVDTTTLSSLEQGFFKKIWSTLPATIDFGPKLTLAATLNLPQSVDNAFGLGAGSQVILNGDLGFNLDDFAGGTASGLGATLTATFHPVTINLPSWLQSSGDWTLSLAVSTGGTLELGLSGSMTATVQGNPYVITVDGMASKTQAGEDISISGGITGSITNLFGLSWLGVTDPTVSLHLHHGGGGTSFDASLDADITISGHTAHVVADISTGDGTQASLSVSSTDPLSSTDVLSFFGIDVSGVSNMPTLTLNSLVARVSVGTTTAFDMVADTTITVGSHDFSSKLLLSLGKDKSGGNVVVGFRPDNTVKLSDLVSSLPSGTDFSFPTLGVVLAHPAQTLTFANLLPDEKDFFQPFCGDSGSPCNATLKLNDGLSIVAAVDMPDSLKPLLGQVHVDPGAPALVTGTLPIFGGSGFSLTVSLPGIPAGPGVPDFIQGGALSMSITDQSLSLTGTMTFNIKKGSVDQADCGSLGGVWMTTRSGGSTACYDQVPLDVTTTITVSPIPSVTFNGGLDHGYAWVSPLGLQWLTINSANVEFGIEMTAPAPTFTFGFELGVTIANHDVTTALLFSVTPLEAPPFVAINVEGFRLTSNEGVSIQDLVDLASAVSGQSLSLGGFPNIALRNIDLRFSEVNDLNLCLPQGLHIAGSLYINPGSGAKGIPQGAGCPEDSGNETNRATDCANDVGNGCFAAIDVGIDHNGVHGSGNLAAFTVGPLSFSGATVDAELTTSVQHLIIKGGMDITGFASGSVDLLVSTTDLHFRGSVAVFGSAFDAYLDGDAAINLTHLTDLTNVGSFSVKAVLKSDFLSQAGVALSGTLQALKPAIQALDVVLTDLANNNPLQAIVDVPAQIAKLGVSLPDPLGSELAKISDVLSTISSDMATFGHVVSYGINDLLNGFDLSFPGIPGTYVPSSPTCITDWVDGTCYSVPPVCFGILGCTDGIPGVVAQPTCLFTVVNGTCYSVPPADFGHIPGLCDGLRQIVPNLSCDSTSLIDDLISPALRSAFKAVTGYDVGNLSLSTVLDDISNALGSGSAFSINCAEFDASATLGKSPAASVSLATDLSLFGKDYNYGIGWNFSITSGNVGQAILDIINSIIHPTTGNTCGLPPDWNSNADYPDAVGTAPQQANSNNPSPPPVTPTMSLSAASSSVDEGSAAVVNGSVSPAPSASETVNLTWGDGTTSTTTVGTSGTFTGSHTYTGSKHEGPFAIHAAITGGPSASAAVTVRNVTPSGIVLTPSRTSINEGDSITLGGSFVDPAADDTHTVSIDWGDGSAPSTLSLAAGVTTFTSGSHTYADNNGTAAGYTVTATVADDDQASSTKTTTVNVANVAPHDIVITPHAPSTGTTPEKQVVTYDVGFTDPGVLDTESVLVTWGDGTPSQTLSIGTARSFTINHQWTEADTSAHPDGKYPVSVTITDKDGGSNNAVYTETVTNVAPNHVTVYTAAPTAKNEGVGATINEGQSVTLRGGFADASGNDSHTVTIDWGVGWGSLERYTVENLPAGTLAYTATKEYGDNGVYTVTVTVADDDNASAQRSTTVTVNNVNPTAVINRSTATTVQGTPTFLGHAGHAMSFNEHTTDPGSDDETIAWSWGDGTATTSTTYLNAPPNPDPANSPQVNPRDITDVQSHTFAAPCVYQTGLSVTDDDAGKATDSNYVVVTGNATAPLTAGQWKSAYSGKGFSTATLNCYLKIVRYMSAVLGSPVTVNSISDAQRVLQPSSSDPHALMARELLVSWLNFANGEYDWNTMVDTNGDGIPDTPFNVVVNAAERFWLSQTATQQVLLNQRNILDSVNNDKG